ncbi:MAG: isoprenylcysteine carboxylmethyltransferase family protein [Ignavibacteriae bacterium]|nr:isoprenylcysteine carboxylmethyltransferase family protein [Ignavibacteriota bacterium]
MNYIFDVLIIIFLFSLFAIPHSILAAFDVKKKITKKVGNKIAFYRFFYNITSVIFFVAIYYISPKPNVKIYDLQFPYDLIIFTIQFLGILGLFWTSSYLNLKEFLGFNQIKRYFQNNYSAENLDENHELIIKGPFKYSRHPIYFFTIIVLGFRSTMDLFYLIFFISMVIYFYIGSEYEEKNLIKRYGDSYLNYKSKVAKIFPNPFSKK